MIILRYQKIEVQEKLNDEKINYQSFAKGIITFTINKDGQNSIVDELELDLNKSYFVYYKSTAIGIVFGSEFNDLSLSYDYLAYVFSDLVSYRLGLNPELSLVANDNFFYPEFFGQVLTLSGPLEQMAFADSYSYLPTVGDNCEVTTGDLLGYLKYKSYSTGSEKRYPIVMPYCSYPMVVSSEPAEVINYDSSLIRLKAKGISKSVHISELYYSTFPDRQTYRFFKDNEEQKAELKKDNLLNLIVNDSSLIKDASLSNIIKSNHNKTGNQVLFDFLKNTDLIINLEFNQSHINIINHQNELKSYFAAHNFNNIELVSFSNYPFFNEFYTFAIYNKLVTYLKQFMHQGFGVVILCQNCPDYILASLNLLVGNYNPSITKNTNKNSSIKVVQIE
jgi:hypothetical protein